MPPFRVIVVGAGMGGLSCAIDLAASGAEVTLVEAASAPGGKMRTTPSAGGPIDSGPTVMTMRWVFEELFAAAGVSFGDRVRLRAADILARHAWPDGSKLDLFADRTRSADAIGTFSGKAAAKGFRDFCDHAGRIHDTLRDTFLTKPANGPVGLSQRIGLGRMERLFDLRPFDTLWDVLGGYFPDPRLRQLFGRYATYCGSSPFLAPATLMLIAHVELEGVWMVEGGLQALADAMAELARSLGVTIRFGGERLDADAVVVNGDPASLRSATPLTPNMTPRQRSLSAITWTAQAMVEGMPLTRHNVAFSDDYPAEFRDLTERGRPPQKPTIYICAQDRGEGSAPPPGPERLLLLINAPPDGDRASYSSQDIRACEKRLIDQMARCGLRLDLSSATVTTPADFERMFPGTGGALYGKATHGWSAAFERAAAGTKVKGLYQAGGGAHPGAGVPMATLSGRLAAQRLRADFASTQLFRRAAITGGTSMR
eukprot:gene16437-16615_t